MPLSPIGLKGNEARFKEVFFWVLIGVINNLFLVQPDLNSVINNQNAEFIPLEGNSDFVVFIAFRQPIV